MAQRAVVRNRLANTFTARGKPRAAAYKGTKRENQILTKAKSGTSTANKKNYFADAIKALEENDQEKLKTIVQDKIAELTRKHELQNYKIVFLHDEEDSIGEFHANQIYDAVSDLKESPKDILLFINSPGGRIEPAYLISKTLKRLCKGKFIVTVPRRAKSAATLISLGADEIHMGQMSELGPIDPQMSGLPAMALGNALDVIAELVCRYPDAAPMFNTYIADQAPIRVLGYYQRINESAVQYAERLLSGKTLPNSKSPSEVAEHLVNHYKDHSFVIDLEESTSILGTIVKSETAEYSWGDEVYNFLNTIEFLCGIKNKTFWLVGDDSSLHWKEKTKKNE